MLPATTRWPPTGKWSMGVPSHPPRYRLGTCTSWPARVNPHWRSRAGGPILAFVEAAGEATKTDSGSSKPVQKLRLCRSVFVAINLRHPPFMRESASRSDHAATSLPSTSRHFAAARQFGRFRTEADIGPDFMSTRPSSPPLASGSDAAQKIELAKR